MSRTEFLVCKTTDPYSDYEVFTDLAKAKAKAAEVGHFHVFEYEIRPSGIKLFGEHIDEEVLVANIYQVTTGEWLRDIVEEDDA